MTVEERIAKTVEMRNQLYVLWGSDHPAAISVHGVASEVFHELTPVQISWGQREDGTWYHGYVSSVNGVMVFCEDTCTVQPPTSATQVENSTE